MPSRDDHDIVDGHCRRCGTHEAKCDTVSCVRRSADRDKSRPIPPSMFSTLDGIDAINARIKELQAERDKALATPSPAT